MKRNKLILTTFIILSSVLFFQCSLDGWDLLDSNLSGSDRKAGLSSKSSEGDITANNLSAPVIWSDGVTLSLPGTFGDEVWNPDSSILIDGIEVYPQHEGNLWQAQSVSFSAGNTSVNIDYIDWGDNLEAKNWPAGAKIRVETVLFKTFPSNSMPQFDEGMTGYDMIYISGQGKTESWGTNRQKNKFNHEGSPEFNSLIYSGCAKLVIQKFDSSPIACEWLKTGENPTGSWSGSGIGAPLFDGGVWESIDGPEGYSAEINIGGKVIYGYNWDTRITGEGPGFYRITFALIDDELTGTQLNTFINESTYILAAEEEVENALTAESIKTDSSEVDLGGGIPQINAQYNLTYIDIELTSKGNGRK